MDENEKFKRWLEKLADVYKGLWELRNFDFSANDECCLSEMDVYSVTPGLNGITIVYSPPEDITKRLKKTGISYMINDEYGSAVYEEVVFCVDGAKFSCLRDRPQTKKKRKQHYGY